MRLKRDRRLAVVAFSGGKDSTAAALLLREQGREVRALTMRLGLPGEEERLGRVEALARSLGLPWRAIDLEAPFREEVMAPFAAGYARGLTPNPCVLCNRRVKFGLLLEAARREAPGASLATGHYADRVLAGKRWFLREPRDRDKSQVYFLAAVGPAALAGVEFPLAGLAVARVRELVSGLAVAVEKESQDICFLQGEDLAVYLGRHAPGGLRPGDILDSAGKVIGRHDGVLRFTVGQRRGTGLAAGRRLYVVGRDLEAGTVTLGEESDLMSQSLTVVSPVYWRPLQAGEELQVKVRYEARGHEARIVEAAAGRVRAAFRKPVRAVTPGQLAVFYDGDVVVAAGEISEA